MSRKIGNGLKMLLSLYGLIITLVLFGMLMWYFIKLPESLYLLQKQYHFSGSMRSAILPLRAILFLFAAGLLSAAVSCVLSLCSKKQK